MRLDALNEMTRNMRLDIIKMCYRLGENAGHLGGCLSLVELLAVLYSEILNFEKDNPKAENRDRIIMSKGQGSIALYAAMHQSGVIRSLNEVGDLLGDNNVYYKQSVRNMAYGIEFSSGSLGQGLAYATGIAWALKWKGNQSSKVYVFLGDGECDEGSVWEAASLASHLKLNNLVVVVDKNDLQIDGFTRDINNMDRMAERWQAFGFDISVINGHDLKEIYQAYMEAEKTRPQAIIAETVKGKGVHFAENERDWHQNVLTYELYKQALHDVGGGEYALL